jgi:hypothetical protein
MAKSKFSNEVNDLARFLEADSRENSEQLQALIGDSESATSAIHAAYGAPADTMCNKKSKTR